MQDAIPKKDGSLSKASLSFTLLFLWSHFHLEVAAPERRTARWDSEVLVLFIAAWQGRLGSQENCLISYASVYCTGHGSGYWNKSGVLSYTILLATCTLSRR